MEHTAACWYLGDGETPGAMAHSHRPSLCLASPYALANGCTKICKRRFYNKTQRKQKEPYLPKKFASGLTSKRTDVIRTISNHAQTHFP